MPQPLLQIVHVSDLHAAIDPGSAARARRALDSIPIAGQLRRKYKRGTQGHDHDAFVQFEIALRDELTRNSRWTPHTWLVDTGDLSTWGDDPGIGTSETFLRDLANDLKIEFSAIYGNHDVWGGHTDVRGLPLFAGLIPGALSLRRTKLRQQIFKKTWPLLPVEGPGRDMHVPTASGIPIVGCSLNSVLHDAWDNFLALGRVQEDWYWAPKGYSPQLQALAVKALGAAVRLVFMHHPVHVPNPPLIGEVLDNADAVATALGAQVGGVPLGMLVVSGHTHKMFPDPAERGALREDLPKHLMPGVSMQAPLGPRQAQLTVGTLSQRNWLPNLGDAPYQAHYWQLLRFEEADDPPHQIKMERIVYKRDRASGPFEPEADADGQFVQSMTIT